MSDQKSTPKWKDKRKPLQPGDIRSYKLPVIKDGSTEFYKWLNGKDSINGIITEALIKLYESECSGESKVRYERGKDDSILFDQDDDIEILEENIVDVEEKEKKEANEPTPNIDDIMKSFGSIKRS